MKTPLLIILFIFLGLFLYTKLVGPIFSANSIQTTKTNLFSVSATGIRLGKIVDVQESSGFEPRPVMMQALEVEKSEDTQIQPGENSINITIILFYETR